MSELSSRFRLVTDRNHCLRVPPPSSHSRGNRSNGTQNERQDRTDGSKVAATRAGATDRYRTRCLGAPVSPSEAGAGRSSTTAVNLECPRQGCVSRATEPESENEAATATASRGEAVVPATASARHGRFVARATDAEE